ncbi:MAG TPA: hypothetical protein PLF81_17015, partial [Candidatus Anammoximicrobium sp.]|nr:hypothetical protein [Candidatus Anammoximicrobium sp.]
MSFIGWHRFPKKRLGRRPIPPLVPDLVVEVLSDTNTKRGRAHLDGLRDRHEKRLQDIIMICTLLTSPRLAGPSRNDVQRGNHDDQAVVQSPG